MENENKNVNTETQNEGQEQETKTYSQEEVDKMLQAEVDRRVTSALQKQAKKNEEKVREAEKLAKMNEEDRYRYELEQREKAIEEKENALALAENKNVCAKILAEKNIPVDFVDFVVTTPDADVMQANINIIDKAFKAAVRAEVERRLASKSPKTSANGSSITREQFSKMGYAERVALKAENPDLYEILSR